MEANAQEKTELEQVVGGTWENVGSSGSVGASAAGPEEASTDQDVLGQLGQGACAGLCQRTSCCGLRETPCNIAIASLVSAKALSHAHIDLARLDRSVVVFACMPAWSFMFAVCLLLHMAPHVTVRFLAYSGFSCQESPANPPPLTHRRGHGSGFGCCRQAASDMQRRHERRGIIGGAA